MRTTATTIPRRELVGMVESAYARYGVLVPDAVRDVTAIIGSFSTGTGGRPCVLQYAGVLQGQRRAPSQLMMYQIAVDLDNRVRGWAGVDGHVDVTVVDG